VKDALRFNQFISSRLPGRASIANAIQSFTYSFTASLFVEANELSLNGGRRVFRRHGQRNFQHEEGQRQGCYRRGYRDFMFHAEKLLQIGFAITSNTNCAQREVARRV
jgi:hypothetical protein